jgi:serine/threonine protein kinase
MIGIYKDEGKQYIVLEYIQQGDVLSLLKRNQDLKLQDLLDIIVSAARGMEYLEQENITHNDLGTALVIFDKLMKYQLQEICLC